MGLLGKITDKFSNTSIKDKNSNTFMHLQKQSESISIDTEVLMKSCETYIKLFNKKCKVPQNLANQGNSKGSKKAPLEIMSLASLQSSQTLNSTCHLSKIYMEYSDSHRHMYEKQKLMVEALNNYVSYLNESLEDFKKYQTTKNIYAKNAKAFVSYQNKLKKQTQPITQEQKIKVENLYKNYTQSLHTLGEKMAELTSNRKEEERTKNFVNLINNEINFYKDVTDELCNLKENIEKSNDSVGEYRYSEKKSVQEFVDEIMSNKLELENFNVGSQTSLNGSAEKLTHQNSDSKNSFSSKENSYQNYGLTDYNGNNYNYDYNVDGYYNDQYNNNGNENVNMQQSNEPTVMNGTSMYNNNISNPEPIDNSPSPFDDFLNPTSIKNTVDDISKPTKDLSSNNNSSSATAPIKTNSESKRKSVVNNENLANLKPNEKVYNTKELNPKYCKAIYPFKKSMDDELELEANDLVDITKKFDDGWATGVNLRSGKDGFFPLNCLLEFYVTDKFADYGGSKENSESYVYSSTD